MSPSSSLPSRTGAQDEKPEGVSPKKHRALGSEQRSRTRKLYLRPRPGQARP